MCRQIPQGDDSGEKWIDTAELEWANVHGGILYNKWYFWTARTLVWKSQKGVR